MKRFLLFVVLLSIGIRAAEQPLSVKIEQPHYQKMKILFCLLKPTQQLREVCTVIQAQLLCPLQKKSGFEVVMQEQDVFATKEQFNTYYKQGFALVVFFNCKKTSLCWRIYDTSQATMVAGKKIEFHDIESTGRVIADALWQELTGQEGIFSTYIAYCKELHNKENNHYFKNIYLKHPFDTQAVLLVQGGKPLAPRWNNDPLHPLLLYSETTPTNVRLMSVTMQGQRRVISNFEGLNMLPSFSQDGCRTVYCLSKNGKSQLYLYAYDKATGKASFSRKTYNEGNNVSPNLRENGDIIFCSDFKTGYPQLFYYHADSQELDQLTKGGYCSCPSFSEKTGKIAYCKIVQGVIQVFLYDIATGQDTQATFDRANKDECSWSPCGNYITYTYEQGAGRRIAVLNLITNEQFFITKAGERCSYPAWSPAYKTYLDPMHA